MSDDRRFLPVVIGPGLYCLPVDAVARIVRFDEINEIDQAADTNSHGWHEGPFGRVALTSWHSAFGSSFEGGHGMALILRGKGTRGLWVDAIRPPFEVGDASEFPLPIVVAQSGHRFFDGVVVRGEEPFLRLNLRGLEGRVGRAVVPLSRPSAPTSPASTTHDPRLIVFSLFGRTDVVVALSGLQVLEVTLPTKPAPVPGAPDDVEGLIVWRGRPVPVVNLARRLSLGQREERDGGESHQRLVIARSTKRGDLWAIMARDDVRVLPADLELAQGSLDVPPSEVRGVFHYDGKHVVFPDMDCLKS